MTLKNSVFLANLKPLKFYEFLLCIDAFSCTKKNIPSIGRHGAITLTPISCKRLFGSFNVSQTFSKLDVKLYKSSASGWNSSSMKFSLMPIFKSLRITRISHLSCSADRFVKKWVILDLTAFWPFLPSSLPFAILSKYMLTS